MRGWDAASSQLVTGRDDTLTRVLASLRDDYADDAADVDGIASTIQRSASAVRSALKQLVAEGAVKRLSGESVRNYRGRARHVFRLGEDYGDAIAQESAWARAREVGDAFDPEAAYAEQFEGDAFDFDPSGFAPEPAASRYEVVGPEEVSPGVVRWQVTDDMSDFRAVARLYAAWGWEAAGEDRPLGAAPHALVILGQNLRPSHRGEGLPRMLLEAALASAWRAQVPLASRADRTHAGSRWWARQARKGRAKLHRYEGEALDGGGSRYVVGETGDYPTEFNPPRGLRIYQECRRV